MTSLLDAAATPLNATAHGHTAITATMDTADTDACTTALPRIETDHSNHGRSTPSPDTRRKRLSFFGRSSTDNSSRKSIPPSQPTSSSPRTSVVPADATKSHLPQRRPGTAEGEHHVRRKTTDQLEHIRHSIFGAKKLTMQSRPSTKRSRHSHQLDERDINNANKDLIPFSHSSHEGRPRSKGNAGGRVFKSEDDFYHHRKKTSISSPYNFKHVMHTSKAQLTRLDTVNEKELSTKLNKAGLRPQTKPRGMSADTLSSGSLRATSASPMRVVSRSATPAGLVAMSDVGSSKARNDGGVDETTFDETQETKFDPAEHFDSFRHSRSGEEAVLRFPRHASSSPALISPRSASLSHTNRNPCNKASEEVVREKRSSSGAASARSQSNMMEGSEDLCNLPIRGRPEGQSFREKQPLPPIPGSQHVANKLSKDSVDSRKSGGQVLPPTTTMKAEYPASVVTERSSKSAATMHTCGSRKTDILEEPNWEDDIDFAFEQEAEATCDFDWGQVPPSSVAHDRYPLAASSSDVGSPDSNCSGGVRLSAWVDEPSAFTSKSARPDVADTGFSTPDLGNGQHRRGPSVGHRGFQAARNASTDKLTKTPPLSVDIVSEQGSSCQPPSLSLTGAEVNVTKSPYSSGSYFPAFDSTIPEYLSDPESTRPGGSKHRKSSSYGSVESSGRSLQSLQAASDSARWSTTSTSSIPELMHSHRKQSRNSIRKSLTSSRPLESVPHSPGIEDYPQQDKPAPAERPTQGEGGVTDSLVMRRPATSSDRALLFNSGRVVQRGRSATPGRTTIFSLPADEQEGGWI